jgi:hypothetical protein
VKISSSARRKSSVTGKAALLSALQGHDRRSIGRSNEVAQLVLRQPRLFAALIQGLWFPDPLVRMRAADAAEKVSVHKPDWLAPFKAELLGLMAETSEQELRWHLALMAPRLPLTALERRRVVALLNSYLDDRSSIVKTFAMQALADLASADASLRPSVTELLRQLTRSGTPAMKARGRKLLARLESAR